MGGGGRYPYPKHVWSPAGGWWGQPANWKMNTFIAVCGIAAVSAAITRGVANREAELAGEPLERRRLTTIWRQFLHDRATASVAKNLEAAEASRAKAAEVLKSVKNDSATD